MANINIVGNFNKSGLTKKQLKEAVEAVFFEVRNKKLKVKNHDKTINIVFVSAEDIQKKNLEYRKKDEPTDVLSFDYGDEGDILLCTELIDKYREGDSLKGSIIKTLIHGALHLFGYTHENKKDRDIMEEAEEKIFIQLSFPRRRESI